MNASARTARRRRTTILAALLVVGAVVVVRGYPSLAASSSPVASPSKTPSAITKHAHHPPHGLPGTPRRTAGQADGVVPDGVTIFDNDMPAVTRLDPKLLSTMRRAATDAGITFYVNSGWRSKTYQEQLLQKAVSKYGSEAEAAKWVATPETSPHVSGDAVDIGHTDADSWLSQHGAAYGLCQIYRNEAWHYELRPAAVLQGCPAMYADPTHDPRMQK